MKPRSHYLLAGVAACVVGACAPSGPGRPTGPATVRVVAVESAYGDLAAQLGGSHVAVTTILRSPSADPHTYEPTARDADAIASADIVIANGLGYDAFVDKLIAASPKPGRDLVVVGNLLHRTGDNPHVWYESQTLELATRAVFAVLERHLTSDGAELVRRRNTLLAWTRNLRARVRAIGESRKGLRVAITEPVFDYVLQAAHIEIATPRSFSHAIEEGNDPAPQDVDAMQKMLANKRVTAFVYNVQTIEPATTRLLAVARGARIAIVPVTESLPPGQTLQIWIDGEVGALDRAR